MLDHDIKQAYQKIAPSSDLKQRILAMRAEPLGKKRGLVVYLKPVMSVAACAVFVLGGIILASRTHLLNPTGIGMNGTELMETKAVGDLSMLAHSAVMLQSETVSEKELVFVPEKVPYTPAVAPRAINPAPAAMNGAAIDLQLSFPQGTAISVEQGVLCLPFEEQGTGEFVPIGQHVFVEREEGMTLIRWVVPMTETDAEYRMTVGDKTICVMYRASANEYRILCIDTES